MHRLIGVGEDHSRIRGFPGQGDMKLYPFSDLKRLGSSQQRSMQIHDHGLGVTCVFPRPRLEFDANVNRNTRTAAKVPAAFAV